MKKHFPGLAAIVLAVAFSAFTTKKSGPDFELKLIVVPTIANVSICSNWTTAGSDAFLDAGSCDNQHL